MLIQIKIIFIFMDHIINTRKGVPFGLPASKSIFKKFLQNLEGKFITSSSKSKALIHYPMGCPRRHCTPDLFISAYLLCMDMTDPCGNPSWSLQSLCIITSFVSSAMEFMVFKRCRYQ